MDDETLTVFADYVCPFCYLGYGSLEQYLESADDPPAVEWHPFDLRSQKRGPDGEIDHSVDDGKDDEYFEQAKQNVRRLAEKYDVEMNLDLARDIDSWDAQKVALVLQRSHDRETFAAFHEAVFDALWVDGRDIGDEDVLLEIAAEAGVQEDVVRDILADEDLDAELQNRFEDAQQIGITGVPTFVYDQHAARGAVPPAQLRQLVGE